jgi:tetratricopeptide (TPR) repeat protein
MDIFEWVNETTESLRENGQARLADLIDELPTACCDAEHERVESMAPEALALARTLKNPWLEVFIRHWLLQSRVLHRHDVSRDTLKQAVSLVEFASRPDTRECPQSICAVQDLCGAYGLVDGAGYAEQRLAVTAEALSRIEPSRACFDCVSAERASALLDSERHQEALDFCDKQLAQQPGSTSSVERCRVRSLLALGRNRDAAQAAQRIDLETSGTSGAQTKALYQCLCEARLGKLDEAQARLPPAEGLEPEHFVDWLRCVRALGTGEGRKNTWRIERAVATMHATFTIQESFFSLAKVHKIAAELALQRGSRFSARRQIEWARQAAAQLVKPDRIIEKLDTLELELENLPASATPASWAELTELLGDDPERDLELISNSASGALEPAEAVELERRRAAALAALRAEDEAQQVLEAAFLKWPGEVSLMFQLLDVLLDRGDHARLEELCAQATGDAVDGAKWYLARSSLARGDSGAARAHCEALLVDHPEHHEARHLLAKVLRDTDELEAALQHFDTLVQAHDPGNLDWDRLLVATLLGRWDAVRDSAARLELPVEPGAEGPIDERWGACRIRFHLAEGHDRVYFAWRTGPVTARIDEVVAPGEEQHHGDVVAFDAEPLNHAELAAHEAEDSQERRPLCEYGSFRVLDSGNYRAFDIDGFSPAPEQLSSLKTELGAIGVVWEQRSGEQYALSFDGESLPAIYAFLGLPTSCTDEAAHLALLAATQKLGLRLVWPKLAAAAGDDGTAAHQRELAESWGIE